ncbi:hypothetical protein GUITHDRAFT_151163 [Guillardia theta CCMP2712]|uniref:Uncharacterized protein n=2 Tax=Guillardia theta TaxID=55529 RepID=L1JQL5_GUITC|nr:hypothetical protein GUITHDRAFT_151163 [Guillardia theta CCMP2712]EKX50480.1 hypothetical protein GUITHDRAFT_151163 [Guillardia theta CCMP2712]|eukprot:XP_005837460.1 hypothetical protein GUITHDRAFT_151163 [Guillardia theta CCMP2712]
MCNLVHGESSENRASTVSAGCRSSERHMSNEGENLAGYDSKNIMSDKNESLCTDDKVKPRFFHFFEHSLYNIHQEKTIDRFGNLSEKTSYSFFVSAGKATTPVIDRLGNFVAQ